VKYAFKIIIFTCLLLVFSSICAFAATDTSIKLTAEEQQWLIKHKEKIFTLGVDPNSGMEYFKYRGEEKGYLIPLITRFKKDLGINIKLETTKSWSEIYSGLHTGSIDILFGANETVERKKTMSFTQPVNKVPYAIIAKHGDSINTIGDIDNKTVGFMKEDIVIDMLPRIYKNIKYKQKLYASREECIAAINRNEVDALIISGGPIIYDHINRFPNLNYAFKLSTITSDLTLSARKNDAFLINILNKEIEHLKGPALSEIIAKGEMEYNLKIMNLTPSELNWLKNDGKAIVGITKDYLPFDYFNNGQYKGISGEIIKEISRKTGIKFINQYSDFDDLSMKLKKGEIDILNIAKTDDRLKYLLYPRPYSTERDIIVGRKDSKDVRDIFGLEGKRVAVIKGFWHYELLEKNLTEVNIVETNSIQESLLLLQKGKVDYLIENPTVVRYYTEELLLYDLVEKGVTSNDSYLYYGITKKKPELASIINKVLPLMDISELTKIGYDEVPHVANNNHTQYLIIAIIGLVILLFFIILYVVKLIKALIKEKMSSELLRQREQLLYTDPLTTLYNRNYFSSKIEHTLDSLIYPQSFIIADINNLKITNDKYGHLLGDELLKCFAELLKQNCPSESLLFRMGGDEFLIIIENTNEVKADQIIKNLKTTSAKSTILVFGKEFINVSAALGYSTRYFASETFDEMFRDADTNMYEDKKNTKPQ